MEDSVEYADAQVLFDTGLSLVCLVDGIRVRVPTFLIESGSEVGRNGDRGKLVIPKSLALNIGLASERGEALPDQLERFARNLQRADTPEQELPAPEPEPTADPIVHDMLVANDYVVPIPDGVSASFVPTIFLDG
jgi:hypothetical protein